MARKEMLRKMKKPAMPMEDELSFDMEEGEELPLEEEPALEEDGMEGEESPEMLEEYRAKLEAAGYTVMAPEEESEESFEEMPEEELEEEY